jgi:hypothetical protein
VIKYENVNVKRIEQGYGIRLYLKLVMNKWKVIGGPTSICMPLGIQLKEASMEVSMCPSTMEFF